MGFPLGDIIRKLGIGGWIGKIFSRTKGISIGNINLSEGHGGTHISKPGESKFDRTPSKPRPSIRPGR